MSDLPEMEDYFHLWADDPKFDKFRRMCRELVDEAVRLNIDDEVLCCGVAWNFNAVFQDRILRAFK